eukprot:CAMPEP_0167813248 /NCGR_PEP_ID=MMETSP0112_2-20121227/1738_1 /TAXON_ID=91324 /ORGANISM="Lotharella globosa, Strain CCCM811" /LENGTH=140 /DNA_ID=CAMNT_0007712289 /DNA_START=91 /DNA_END=513 /DNA_ORIENTATION=+
MNFDYHYTWAKLLRACEVVEGKPQSGPAVPVPSICSTRRVFVEGAGIPEVNGEYVNSGMGVNGRVFTRRVRDEIFVIRKLYSGHQLFWYLSRNAQRVNAQQLYWANVPFMEHSTEEGYPPRSDWGAFHDEHLPAPATRVS